MLYNFELQMLGLIILPVMVAGGIFMWLKARKANRELPDDDDDDYYSKGV